MGECTRAGFCNFMHLKVRDLQTENVLQCHGLGSEAFGILVLSVLWVMSAYVVKSRGKFN
jgi:hypothetical protein